MRCTSSCRRVSGRISAAILGPNVRLGTKRPSITSKCTQSAWAFSIFAKAERISEKSADRREGAKIGASMRADSIISGSFAPRLADRRLSGNPFANAVLCVQTRVSSAGSTIDQAHPTAILSRRRILNPAGPTQSNFGSGPMRFEGPTISGRAWPNRKALPP